MLLFPRQTCPAVHQDNKEDTDAFYDRCSTFISDIMFSEPQRALTQNRRNANLVSRKDFLVYSVHETIHRDPI